jgi:outer membrane biosynthesis protein TonB
MKKLLLIAALTAPLIIVGYAPSSWAATPAKKPAKKAKPKKPEPKEEPVVETPPVEPPKPPPPADEERGGKVY